MRMRALRDGFQVGASDGILLVSRRSTIIRGFQLGRK
jgi:hypothetical protein